MLLEVVHRTAYHYDRPVRHSKNEVRATPVTDASQICLEARLRVTPSATFPLRYRDYFGTEVTAFDIDGPHDGVEVVASSVVEREPGAGPGDRPIADGWVANGDPRAPDLEMEEPEFLLPSPLVGLGGDVADLARDLAAGDPVVTVDRVQAWVREALRYERGATGVGTTVDEVLRRRRGVCQDFAHVTCALLRAAGVAARYVSGYYAPKPLAVGEATQVEGHAWVEALLPGHGWWAFDPTNDQAAGERHVKVGHGRDYQDVTPIKGVYRGGHSGRLEVEVRVRRLPDDSGDPLEYAGRPGIPA